MKHQCLWIVIGLRPQFKNLRVLAVDVIDLQKRVWLASFMGYCYNACVWTLSLSQLCSEIHYCRIPLLMLKVKHFALYFAVGWEQANSQLRSLT